MTKLFTKFLGRVVPALMVAGLLMLAAKSQAGVSISINVAPPVLPVYVQPPCPSEGYIWMPGYWAYGPAGYYWVPGTWVLPPQPGLLWTPGYWGWSSGLYYWHEGYWGLHVGFYGGVHYGFGYPGSGFYGGYWNNGHFLYNTAVTHVNVVNVHNVYNKTVIVNNTYVNNTRVSYNSGGGTTARPTVEERAAMGAPHIPPTEHQLTHARTASMDRQQLVSVNQGRPASFAVQHPMGVNRAEFHDAEPQNRPQPQQYHAQQPQYHEQQQYHQQQQQQQRQEYRQAPAEHHEGGQPHEHEREHQREEHEQQR